MTIETLNATLLTVAEAAVNRLLLLNPLIAERLTALEGRVIAVELTAPQINLSIQPGVQGLQIDMIERSDADVTLSGTASDFLRLLSARESSDAMFGKSIRIQGDSALATRFSQILIDAALDWEALLSEIMGDLPAHQIARYLRWKAGFYLNLGNSLMLNLEEYLKEEIRLLPSRPELELFSNQVDRLRQETERSAARIERLKQRLQA